MGQTLQLKVHVPKWLRNDRLTKGIDMRILLSSSIILLTSLFSTQVSASGVEISSCDTEECEQIFKDFREHARYGSPQAQMIVAAMLYSGHGVEKDVKEALKWYRRAGKYQLPFALYRSALMFLYEPEIEQNIPKGIWFLERAVKRGSLEAANTLADIHIEGKLVDKDLKEAGKWLKAGSDLGDKQAAYRLGVVFEAGVYGDDNKSLAIDYYKKAAEQNHQEATDRLIALGAIEKEIDIFASTDDDNFERIEVTAPNLDALLDISLLAIRDSGLYNSKQSCSRVPVPMCALWQKSIVYSVDIENFMAGR